PFVAVRVGTYRDEYGNAHIDLAGIEKCDPTFDDALFLELLDAPPARRGRQADLLGHIGNRECRVLLEQSEDFSVQAIHWAFPEKLFREYPLYPPHSQEIN